MIKTLLIVLALGGSIMTVAQVQPEQAVLQLNQDIDAAIVRKDIARLTQCYADDFVFTHGTGYVDNKESWLKDVAKPETHFVSRQQDSTTVELHGDVALVTGRLQIVRQDKKGPVRYGIWYIRVYATRQQRWQLISHRTTREWHN